MLEYEAVLNLGEEMNDPKKQYYPFRQFAHDIMTIADVLRRMEEKQGKKFKKIYAPLRGGMIPAICLSHQLSNEEAGHKVLVTADPPTAYEEGALIVDDIADTGKTLCKFAEMGFPVVTIFKQTNCSFDPTIWVHAKYANWIEFWWEADDLLAEK